MAATGWAKNQSGLNRNNRSPTFGDCIPPRRPPQGRTSRPANPRGRIRQPGRTFRQRRPGAARQGPQSGGLFVHTRVAGGRCARLPDGGEHFRRGAGHAVELLRPNIGEVGDHGPINGDQERIRHGGVQVVNNVVNSFELFEPKERFPAPPSRVSTTKFEWLPDDPTAFAPTKPWKLPWITTWDDSQNRNQSTNSAEEARISPPSETRQSYPVQ